MENVAQEFSTQFTVNKLNYSTCNENENVPKLFSKTKCTDKNFFYFSPIIYSIFVFRNVMNLSPIPLLVSEQILNNSSSFNMVIHSLGAPTVMDTMTEWISYLLAWPYISKLFTGILAVY